LMPTHFCNGRIFSTFHSDSREYGRSTCL